MMMMMMTVMSHENTRSFKQQNRRQTAAIGLSLLITACAVAVATCCRITGFAHVR